ncbi:MAG: hypothetical protein ICV80_24625, partial [Microcoleus sp. T1-bin1]|nr:hypothetical protein [Microcoleus sp. T1-bin1]
MVLIKKNIVNPLQGWQVGPDEINYLGKDLQRPECILTEKDGTVWSADARGGVMKLNTDGTQQLIKGNFGEPPEAEKSFLSAGSEISNPKSEMVQDIRNYQSRYIQATGSLPNGLCLDANGDFIIAIWGTNHIERMTREGKLTTILAEIDGQPLGKTNFPLRDSEGRIWFSVTTQTEPWSDQINTRATDGYIALIDNKGARIVA